MIKNKNIMIKNKLKILLVIVSIIKLSQCQSNPCPQLFNYVKSSQTGQPEGRITISGIQPGQNQLVIKMTYPPHIVNNYAGSIGLTRSNTDIVRDLLQNRPVQYRVNFPTTNPLPTLKEININGRTLCRNSVIQNGVSEIVLTHTLNVPNTIQLASNTRRTNSRRRFQQQLPASSSRIQTPSQPSTSQSLGCGKSLVPISLIFHGKAFKPGSWPWLAPMFSRNSNGQLEYKCAGTIIAPHAIITAAHCVVESGRTRSAQSVVFGLGVFNIYSLNEPNTHIANVKSIIPHPDYSRRSIYDGDIAIIILSSSYNYNQRIQPACMWKFSSDLNGIINKDGQVAGWGLTRGGASQATEPSIVGAKVISNEQCLRSNSIYNTITSERNFCAGYRDNSGPCTGDSGSGFIMEVGHSWYLRAIVSGAIQHVRNVCDLREYVVYTDVAKYVDWIRQYVSI